MIDLNQELEDFDAYFFQRHGELPLDPTSEEYANKSYLKHEMFKAWKAGKAQRLPDQTINEIQSWIAVQSTQAMELDGEEFVVGANELAEFIEKLVKSELGAEG
ncbi:hypothetical protein AB552B1_03036 [Acinetobacter baumannii]|uniref:hypothetical protein n=1 Tax=Acinetobacter baumannii TaxID=470 RepID=UPI00135FD9F4|nr:hypothetical protein [Acinetobacter baumannii]CAA0259252.1 hypothetical protein AB552B1_03036 [Acinetobacter baumannii]